MTAAAGSKTKALCVATPCVSVEQFVATFHKYCDESTIFVATLASRPVGLETAFSIELADRTPVLQGMCEVVDAWGTPASPYGRPGILLEIRRLTRPSVDVFQKLRARRGVLPKGALRRRASSSERSPTELARDSVTRTPSTSTGIPVELPGVSVDGAGPQVVVSTTRYPFTVTVAPAKPARSLVEKPRRPATPVPAKLPGLAAKQTPPRPVTTLREPAREAAAADDSVDHEAPTVVLAGSKTPIGQHAIDEPEVPTVVRGAPATATPLGPVPAVPATRPTPKPAKPTPNMKADFARETAGTAAAKLRAMATEAVARLTAAQSQTSEAQPPGFSPPTPPPLPEPPLGEPAPPPALASEPPTTVGGPSAPDGERVPGSEIVLPANPLMNLTDTSLEGFVDCMLFERADNFSVAPDGEGDSPRVSLVGIEAISAPLVFDPPPGTRPSPPPPARVVNDVAVIVAPSVVAEGGVVFESRPAVAPPPTAVIRATTAPRVMRWWPIGAGAAVVGVAIGVIVVLATGSSASNDGPPAQAVHATAPHADPKPAAPPPTDEPPVVGKGPCRVTVVATPAGSTVEVDGRDVGQSPISIDGPCQKTQITITHARYETEEHTVEPAPGTPEKLDVTLERPTHAVMVTTSPRGATISLDGKRAGTSPTLIQVMGFQPVRLTAEKSGFKTATVNLYSRVPRDRLSISLERSPKRTQ